MLAHFDALFVWVSTPSWPEKMDALALLSDDDDDVDDEEDLDLEGSSEAWGSGA